MSYTELVPKELKPIRTSNVRLDKKPYTNFEKNDAKKESIYKNLDKEVGKTIIEMERLRRLIFNDMVEYTRDQLMGESEFFDPLYEAAVEGIDGLDFDDFDDNTLKEKVELLFPDFDMEKSRVVLLPEERAYLSTNTDNLQQLADFADGVQIDAEKALIFTSVLRTRLKSAMSGKALTELLDAYLELSPEINDLLSQGPLSRDGKEKLRDLLVQRHNDAYERWFGEPNEAVQKKWRETKDKYFKEIDRMWLDDYEGAKKLIDQYFEAIKKRVIHLASVEFKHISSANRVKRGRKPKNMSTYVPNKMKKIIDEIPDVTLWKFELEKRAKQYTYS
jgi:hypothetical protein